MNKYVNLSTIVLSIVITTRCYALYSYSINGETPEGETFKTVYSSESTENGYEATLNITIISPNKTTTLLGGISKSLISYLEGVLRPDNMFYQTKINIELLYPLGGGNYARKEFLQSVEGIPVIQVWINPYFTNNGNIKTGVFSKADGFRYISGSELHVKDVLTGDYRNTFSVREDHIMSITPFLYGAFGEMISFNVSKRR